MCFHDNSRTFVLKASPSRNCETIFIVYAFMEDFIELFGENFHISYEDDERSSIIAIHTKKMLIHMT